MSSLWNRSGTVERYADDIRAAGAKAYFFQGGTLTPLSVFEDSGESAAHTHPVLADANGRWPDIFVPYVASFDVRVTSADDVQLTYSLEVPNPDPVELSVTIPAEEKVQTGMIHCELVNSTKTAYVRLNGRTMGNGASSGTERANADTSALFTYLWNSLTDAVAPVSGGRGGSAAADFGANKTITLPSFQGAIPIGLDDMGAAAGGFFTGLTFSVGSAIVAGSRTGTNGMTLLIANLPAHTHAGTTSAEGAHTHTGTTSSENVTHTHTASSGVESVTHTHTFSGTTTAETPNLIVSVSTNTAAGAAGLTFVQSVAANNTLGSDSTFADHTHDYSGTTGNASVTHTHTITVDNASAPHSHTFTTSAGSLHSHTFTTDSVGSGTALNNLPRSVLVTWFIKL